MKENLPGVDTSEAPYYTAVIPDGDRTKTLYFCSSQCITMNLRYR